MNTTHTPGPTPDHVRWLLDDSVRRKLAHAAREVARLEQLAAHPDRVGVAGLLLDARQELAMLAAIAARRGIAVPGRGQPVPTAAGSAEGGAA